MKISVDSKIIESIDFSKYETAWTIEDSFLVLEYLREKKKVVLGGDILNSNLEYAYANWHYDDTPGDSTESIAVAAEYLARLQKRIGNSYYVVFVVKGGLS